jgi:hypothetical protein
MINKDDVKKLLERIGTALSSGDLPGAVNCWEIPALLLSDEGARAVSESVEFEEFYRQATEWYHQQGLMSTRPEIGKIEILSETLASADVRWPSFDAQGKEKSSERSHYLIQLGKDGQARIRVALSRTA